MEIKELRLRFLEDDHSEMWRQKEQVRMKKKLKVLSWENFFKYKCNIK